jgi:ribosomal-protein-alanine N-acetyltransferase
MYGISFCYFYLIEKSSGNNIGWCGFHKWYTRHSRGELGYVMTDEPAKGKGYMKEALGPVLKYGFNTLKLHRVEAMVAAWNEPSLKLLKGNGFVNEGNLREHYFENNIYDDSLMFSLLVGEYTSKKI